MLVFMCYLISFVTYIRLVCNLLFFWAEWQEQVQYRVFQKDNFSCKFLTHILTHKLLFLKFPLMSFMPSRWLLNCCLKMLFVRLYSPLSLALSLKRLQQNLSGICRLKWGWLCWKLSSEAPSVPAAPVNCGNTHRLSCGCVDQGCYSDVEGVLWQDFMLLITDVMVWFSSELCWSLLWDDCVPLLWIPSGRPDPALAEHTLRVK